MHVPKTGGLTLRQLIWRQYKPGATYNPRLPGGAEDQRRQAHVRWLMEGGQPDAVSQSPLDVHMAQIRALPPERLSRVRVVLGHMRFGIHEAVPGPSTYITILRDPLDRVLSGYHHRATRHGLRMSVEDYIRSERDTAMDNLQTRNLSRGASLGAAITSEQFESAVSNLREHFSVVGMTERFDLSVLAMARTFGWHKLGYVPYNVSRGRPRVEDLPDDVADILRRHNEYDLELVRIAHALLDRRVEELGIDPDRDVAAYRRRLAVYRRMRPAYDRALSLSARLMGRPVPRDVRLRREKERT